MKSFKVLIVIVVSVIISYYTAVYFGSIYNKFFPFELNSGWVGSSQSVYFLRGISLSLIFFLILFSYSFVFKSKKSVLWLISPLILWEVSFDLKHIYIPIILGLVAYGLASVIRKILPGKSVSE